MEQAAQGSGHSTTLMEFKEHLDNAVGYRIWLLGGPLWSQELGSVVLVGLFHHTDPRIEVASGHFDFPLSSS